jgi:uncharacterized protein with HEPN domain
MTSRRAYSIYVGHIRDKIQHALQFTAGFDYDRFAADNRTSYATVRALEIVGEAAKRVPNEIRSLDPTIPWRKMAGMRDVITHRCDEVNLTEVWDVVQSNLEELLLAWSVSNTCWSSEKTRSESVDKGMSADRSAFGSVHGDG